MDFLRILMALVVLGLVGLAGRMLGSWVGNFRTASPPEQMVKLVVVFAFAGVAMVSLNEMLSAWPPKQKTTEEAIAELQGAIDGLDRRLNAVEKQFGLRAKSSASGSMQ